MNIYKIKWQSPKIQLFIQQITLWPYNWQPRVLTSFLWHVVIISYIKGQIMYCYMAIELLKIKWDLVTNLNVTSLFQLMSLFFNVCSISCTITILLGHFRLCTVPLDNSNAANKSRIVSIRFSKTGCSNMFTFTPVLDFYTDFLDVLWNIFVLLAPFCYMALFITSSVCTLFKIFWKSQRNFSWEKFTMWSCASNYPINCIWTTDWLTDSCVNCTMPPLLQVLILPKNKMSDWFKS